MKLLVFALLLSLTSVHAQESGVESPLQSALSDLGHRDFAKRNAATLAIWKIGRPALEDLQKLVESSPDPETVQRASELALRIDLGIAPGAPREILDFLEKYQNALPENRTSLLRTYFRNRKQPATVESLLRLESPRDPSMAKNEALRRLANILYLHIVKSEAKATTRLSWEAVFNYLESGFYPGISRDALKSVLAAQASPPYSDGPPPQNSSPPRTPLAFTLSQEGALPALDSLRRDFAAGDTRSETIRRLALFESLVGNPDKAITETTAQYTKSPNPNLASLLIYLHRLNGDLAKATPYAKDFPEIEASSATFADLGDWDSFQAGWLTQPHPELNPTEATGIKAALGRLAKDDGARLEAIQRLASLEPASFSDRHQQLENLVLLGQPESALGIVERNLATKPGFSSESLYARWKIALLVADGKPEDAIAFASPIVEAHPWRSSQLTSEFASLLTSHGKKLPKFLTEVRYVPTNSIGSYIATLKNAGEAKRLETYNQIANYRSTLPRQRRFAEGHFPDAPDGHSAMWWFYLSKKFTADSYADRLPRIASRLAALPQAGAPDGIKPASPEVITDDLAAMFQKLSWLANRCTGGNQREAAELLTSMASRFARPDNQLHQHIERLAISSTISPNLLQKIANYYLEHNPPEKAHAIFDTMEKGYPDPIIFAARAKIETVPDKATKLLLHAHLLPLEDPKSRHALSQFFTHLGLTGEAAKSNRILQALWSPPRDGFAPAILFPGATPEDSNKATKTLRAQREWLQHFTARTFRPLTEPPPEAP